MARKLGLAEVPARVLGPGTTDGDCLRLALFDNLAHRRSNAIERAMILAKLDPHVGREGLITDYLPLLGLQPSAALLERTMALNRLVASLQTAVAEGRIEENVAARLADLPATDQEAFAGLFERCRPSVSVAREWAELLMDIARRDGVGIGEILASPDVASISDSGEAAPGDKTAELRDHFHRLRYPKYSAHERQFADARGALKLPPSMRLQPAPRFESDEMRLEIRFRSEEELRRAASVMGRWFDDPTLVKRLWPDRS